VCAGKLLVNFDKGIQEVMWESRWLGHLGFHIPQTAQAILLQEEKFNVYYQQLSHALEASFASCSLCMRGCSAPLQSHST